MGVGFRVKCAWKTRERREGGRGGGGCVLEIWRGERTTTPRFGLKITPTRCDARNDAPLPLARGQSRCPGRQGFGRNSAPRETIVPRRIPTATGGRRGGRSGKPGKIPKGFAKFSEHATRIANLAEHVYILCDQVFAHDTKCVRRRSCTDTKSTSVCRRKTPTTGTRRRFRTRTRSSTR